MAQRSRRETKRKVFASLQNFMSVMNKEHDKELWNILKGGGLREIKGTLKMYSIRLNGPVILLQHHQPEVQT